MHKVLGVLVLIVRFVEYHGTVVEGVCFLFCSSRIVEYWYVVSL